MIPPRSSVAPRRILVTPWLLKGHSLPVLVVARALRARGHEVLFVTEPGLEPDVKAAGCTPIRLPGDRRGKEILSAKNFNNFRQILTNQAEQTALFVRGLLAKERIDGVVTDIFQVGTALALEGTEIPWASVNICGPFVGGPPTYLSAHATLPLARTRARLGLPPSKVNSYDLAHSPGLVLLAWSRDFECYERSPQSVHVGFLNWTGEERALPKWLKAADDGRPRVLVTLTTNQRQTVERKLVKYVNDSICALSEMDVHAFVGISRGDPRVRVKPASNVKLVGFVANDRVIPECDALVFNGGWGTAGYALQAGVPSVIVPVTTGHPEAAEICDRLNVSVQLPFEQLSAVAICDRLHRVLSSEGVQRRAATEQARKLAQVDAAASAAQRIEEHFAGVPAAASRSA